jgi:hypothetical protein
MYDLDHSYQAGSKVNESRDDNSKECPAGLSPESTRYFWDVSEKAEGVHAE